MLRDLRAPGLDRRPLVEPGQRHMGRGGRGYGERIAGATYAASDIRLEA